jgi:TPP-dependent pyruvate/acetoin dehydrogenase alpha subunit
MATYRHSGHYVGDAEQYRSRDEVVAHRSEQDPIRRFIAHVLAAGIITDVDVAELRLAVGARIEAAEQFAEAAPFPDPGTAMRDVFTEAGA